jgi:hypothetical protein
MKRRSPTLEGFQTMFRLPVLGLAEISWRWTFGVAATAALLFALREYLATLPVTAGEMLLFRTRQPALILRALARIFQGSVPRAAITLIVLIVGLTLGWIVVASIGRALTLKALLEYVRSLSGSSIGSSSGSSAGFRDAPDAERPTNSSTRRLLSLLMLNTLRAALLLAGILSVVGAMLIAQAASSPDDPSPGRVLLIFWMLTMVIGLVCPLLNWYLSLAALFVVRDEASALGGLVKVTDLCRKRPGSLAAIATWFGIAHAVVFVVASSAAAVPLGFGELLPAGMVFGGLLMVALLYFAAADFLYVGRLAAYLSLIEQPEIEFAGIEQPEPARRPVIGPSDDDILSDIPGLVPPFEAAGS